MQELVKAFEQIQALYNLNDSQFAKSLGFDPSLICRMKKGDQEPSSEFLAALVAKYPELKLQVMNYLESRGAERKQSDGKSV